MPSTRQIIDYAYDDNAKEFRDELYASIHDRISAHIEQKKIEVAQTLITQEASDCVTKPEATGIAKGEVKKHEKKMHGEEVELEDLEEAKEDSPVKGTVKKATYEHGPHKVEVRYNHEWQEYSVHPYKNGKHMGEGPVSYHGDDKDDAHSTAQHMLKHLNK